MGKDDERELADIAKRVLAMPPKQHKDMKVGRRKVTPKPPKPSEEKEHPGPSSNRT